MLSTLESVPPGTNTNTFPYKLQDHNELKPPLEDEEHQQWEGGVASAAGRGIAFLSLTLFRYAGVCDDKQNDSCYCFL